MWIGSRSKLSRSFRIPPSMTVSAFKKLVWQSYHGEEALGMEEKWHEEHNLCLKSSGKYLPDAKTFGDLGFKPTPLPYELTFILGLKSGQPL